MIYHLFFMIHDFLVFSFLLFCSSFLDLHVGCPGECLYDAISCTIKYDLYIFVYLLVLVYTVYQHSNFRVQTKY